MAHPNEKLLRANYHAVAEGDVQPLLNACAEDIGWHVSGRGPLAGDYDGRQGVLDFFAKMMELYGDGSLEVDVIDVLANGDHGIVLTRERAIRNGRQLAWRGVHRWEFRDGKCVSFDSYADDAYEDFWAAAA